MSTNSPPAKSSESPASTECRAAAVAAKDGDHDVIVVGAGDDLPSSKVTLKKEKIVDVTNDPAFSMLQQGGGQVRFGFCSLKAYFLI